MKLLLDQGLPRGAVAALAQLGIAVTHVSDVGLALADDPTIIDHARINRQTIVTLDADFHAILALTHAIDPSVIRIRIEGLKSQECADVIGAVINKCKQELVGGAFVTVTSTDIRVRRLPILP